MSGRLSPKQQLRERGFAHFRNCFTPEFVEELRVFVDESEQGVAKYYPTDGTADLSRPSGQGNVFQGDQLSMSFREEAIAAPAMACGSALARLVAWPRSIEALQACGVESPKLWAGYILSKGAGGPPLYWCVLHAPNPHPHPTHLTHTPRRWSLLTHPSPFAGIKTGCSGTTRKRLRQKLHTSSLP